MFEGPYARLLTLLKREAALLRQGDIDQAAKLGDSKERLLAALKPAMLSTDQIAVMRGLADHNQRLVDAAGRGIRAAQTRLRTLRRGVSVNTYAANGTRELIRQPESTMQKRA